MRASAQVTAPGAVMPVGLGVVGVAVMLSGGNFVDEDLFVGNTAIEALRR